MLSYFQLTLFPVSKERLQKILIHSRSSNMVTLDALQDEIYRRHPRPYQCDRPINLYQSPLCQGLVTQADSGHHLHALEVSRDNSAIRVRICKDDYPGWIAAKCVAELIPAAEPYQAPVLTFTEIHRRLPEVMAFAKAAMAVPNQYLWGGAIAPNYDCSGLVQAAFLSAGIPLPRDSYQQEDFTEKVAQSDLQPGDLVFFGTAERTTHVAIYLGEGRYIHSSGKDKGRNGIGIDSMTDLSDPVSAGYAKLLRCFGRVVKSYQPTG
ncbi:MAG: C40 family peptidase [Phormidesmis sp.]